MDTIRQRGNRQPRWRQALCKAAVPQKWIRADHELFHRSIYYSPPRPTHISFIASGLDIIVLNWSDACPLHALMQNSLYALRGRCVSLSGQAHQQTESGLSQHARPRSLSIATRSSRRCSRSIAMLTTSKCRALGGRKLGQQCRWVTQNYIKRLANADDNWAQRAEQVCKGDRMSIIETLEQRGFVNQIIGTRPSLKKVLDHRRVGVYCGIDPTAPSMHVGHMVPFMALSWMYIHGYSVTFLLGGATARIGDPEGRLAAREGVSSAERKANMSLMHNQLKRFGASMERYAARRGYEREWAWRRSLRNNADWHTRLIWTDLLREMGQYLRIGPMLGRDSVKNRQEKGDGMSFAEFSYPLVQAWDWWVMFKTGTQIQIGGADQFGNILAGAEAVKQAAKHSSEWQSWLDKEYKSVQEQDRPELSEDPMGFTVPLLTTASGEKFGKSAGNAVWLDAGMTSVFELYQVSTILE